MEFILKYYFFMLCIEIRSIHHHISVLITKVGIWQTGRYLVYKCQLSVITLQLCDRERPS